MDDLGFSFNVVFRADASVQIGTGHLMRCLTLADELTRQGHECRFICRKHKGHLGELISGKGYELTLLPAIDSTEPESASNRNTTYADWLGVPWPQDAEQTLEALMAFKADWLVVDHYALDASWEQQIAKAVGRIMVIDDLADRNHECALLLDQNLGRSLSDYDGLVPQHCQRLIGPDYALLRPEFAKLRERSLKRRARPELKRILISLGGVDRANVTGQVLSALGATALPWSTHLDIIMGEAAPYLDEVKQQAAQLLFKATVSVNVRDIAERMYLADLSIGAAGSTAWERCCLGLPAITVILADNQRLIGYALARSESTFLVENSQIAEGIVRRISWLLESTEERQRYSRNAAAVCDGAGTIRTISRLIASSQT
ncbi:UDP-2,4-diacetamido-2,4,6-trideoxy-beta-L-altropyranose hydrolase [Marinobacter psychrophilus]|uniref:UDP-2,4-diacetamido-2,4, 6-trideoxy-beta-L-altropyranose hydrolase n=1 Tax=Marinobacter psychrophilus TaxID=330734 RepID=UPI001B448C27|nr:UDP-2,4-diacetamido-2,4,6-trideoxy-beta-L-altropyranose hydrolase [Marinobacter psychrophilus]MBQ0764463.1 UDP-2,4-diacetamido-2,4,6-trideoxy-beta-L-altropyranose hydrolase [Marinobacter psychrophilus]MBQ0846314.1 UDP-2,4-diacetamido-2,4,6-trideoxy-beta-L-altropyranose hydrolase [Marinobacter psychrophilus]